MEVVARPVEYIDAARGQNHSFAVFLAAASAVNLSAIGASFFGTYSSTSCGASA